MGFTTTEANATLTARVTTGTKYLALFTVAPTDAGGGTEVSGGGYVRQSITFTTPASRTTSNSAEISFPEATADWGTVVAGALYDAASGGNMLWHDGITTERTVTTGTIFRVPVGSLDITFDATV